MNANLDNQPTESSLFEEEPVGSKTDVKDEEKSSVSSLDSKIVKFEESEQLSEYQQTLEGPFTFDAALFSEFVGWFLLSFVSGHIAGRISRLMRI